MKDKMIYLILGILIGAVITAGCFLLFSKNNNRDIMERGDRPEMGNFVVEPKEGEIGEPPQMNSETTSSNTTL